MSRVPLSRGPGRWLWTRWPYPLADLILLAASSPIASEAIDSVATHLAAGRDARARAVAMIVCEGWTIECAMLLLYVPVFVSPRVSHVRLIDFGSDGRHNPVILGSVDAFGAWIAVHLAAAHKPGGVP